MIAGNNTAYTLYNTGEWTDYPEPDDIQPTPMPVEGVFEITSSEISIDVSTLKMYDNTTSATSQNRGGSSALMEIPSVKLSDGSANITFGNLSGNNERIASVKIVRVPQKYRKPVIWIAGDSEAANYYPISDDDHSSEKIMITGFGQQLGKVLSDKYSVSNYGQPSATVKTWYDECFEAVNGFMQSGDTILIDFGINDAISSSNKISVDEMKQYMKTIIDAAKAKGVTPIIISPVYNSKYQHRSYFTYDTSSETNTMYDFAAEMEQMGYETANVICNYTDISNILDGNIRGDKTNITRIYSVKEMKKFMGISDKVSVSYNNNTLTITANDATLKSAVVIKAEYDINIMSSVKTYPIIFKDKQAVIENIEITANEKVYVWNSINEKNGMKPLADVFVR